MAKNQARLYVYLVSPLVECNRSVWNDTTEKKQAFSFAEMITMRRKCKFSYAIILCLGIQKNPKK